MIQAVVFDAYGTLLDIHAAMARHAARIGPHWPQVSADWRTRQIEYSWVRSLAGRSHHRDFWRLTQEALAWAAVRHGITDPGLLADVLQSYRLLDAHAEVPAVLAALRGRGMSTAILSNGTPDMLQAAVSAAGLTLLLDAILSVEAVGVFKPDPRVYRLATQRFGLAAKQIAFVSANPWDAFGALSAGFKVYWVNRTSIPYEYDLDGAVTELRTLSALPDLLACPEQHLGIPT